MTKMLWCCKCNWREGTREGEKGEEETSGLGIYLYGTSSTVMATQKT